MRKNTRLGERQKAIQEMTKEKCWKHDYINFFSFSFKIMIKNLFKQ